MAKNIKNYKSKSSEYIIDYYKLHDQWVKLKIQWIIKKYWEQEENFKI